MPHAPRLERMSIGGDRRFVAVAALLLGLLGSSSRPVAAQGLAGAAVEGLVTSASDTTRRARGVDVTLTSLGTGVVRRTRSAADGSFRFETVDVGYYRME